MAAIALFCMPLATAPASISLIVLLVYFILRLPTLWRTLTPLVMSSLAWALACWFVISLLMIIPSPDRSMGFDHIGAMRMLLLPLLLWPVLDRWRLLVGGLILGVAVQNSIQIMQMIMLASMGELEAGMRISGAMKHPGHLGGYCVLVILVEIALMTQARKLTTRFVLGILATLALLGLLMTASRGVALGFVGGVLVVSCSLWICHWIRPRTILLGGFGAALVILPAMYIGSATLWTRMSTAWMETVEYVDRDSISTTVGIRLYWWESGWIAFKEAPVTGHGNGSTAAMAMQSPLKDWAESIMHGSLHERLVPTHPHSVYIQTLAEQGIIGTLVLAWVLVAGVWTLLKSARISPLGCGLLGGMVSWMIASVFEGQHLSGQSLSALMIPLAIGGIGLLPKASGPPGNGCCQARS